MESENSSTVKRGDFAHTHWNLPVKLQVCVPQIKNL